jgi:cholesterol transport system auxiliary component
MTKAALLYCAVLIGITGCGALLGKAEPLNVRYFAPALAAPAQSNSGGTARPLRLGRIEASDHLRERIAFRVSEQEIGFHEGLRWTETPDAYFRRALGRELFENGSFAHVIAGVAPTLEAELVAFEDLRERKAVRVEARVLVHDGRRVVLERTFRVEESRKDDSPAAITDALSKALQACVGQISTAIDGALRSSASGASAMPEPTTPS